MLPSTPPSVRLRNGRIRNHSGNNPDFIKQDQSLARGFAPGSSGDTVLISPDLIIISSFLICGIKSFKKGSLFQVGLKMRIARLRFVKFCWNRIFASTVMNISNSCSAFFNKAPFCREFHSIFETVFTSYSLNSKQKR